MVGLSKGSKGLFLQNYTEQTFTPSLLLNPFHYSCLASHHYDLRLLALLTVPFRSSSVTVAKFQRYTSSINTLVIIYVCRFLLQTGNSDTNYSAVYAYNDITHNIFFYLNSLFRTILYIQLLNRLT